MKKAIIFLFAISLGMLSSCEEDIPEWDTNIDAELLPYFQSFEDEGWERGIPVDLSASRVEARIQDIAEDQIVGQCLHFSEQPNRLIFDVEYWNRASHLQREFYVFHELGHCYLNRAHLDMAYPDGNCVSIMQSGTGTCRFLYRNDTRESYLDELFYGE